MAALSNVYEIIIKGHYVATGTTVKNLANVFHYKYNSGGVSPGSASDLLTAFLAGPWAAISAQLTTAYVGDDSLCRRLDDALAQFISGGAPANGARATPRFPGDVAVAYLLRTPSRGKSFKGSKHFGPVAAADVVGDEISGGAVAAWTAVGVSMGNVLVGAGGTNYQPVILSRVLSQLRFNPTTLVGDVVNAVLLNKTIGTMRRRKEKTVR
jgi:hypothetical protein